MADPSEFENRNRFAKLDCWGFFSDARIRGLVVGLQPSERCAEARANANATEERDDALVDGTAEFGP